MKRLHSTPHSTFMRLSPCHSAATPHPDRLSRVLSRFPHIPHPNAHYLPSSLTLPLEPRAHGPCPTLYGSQLLPLIQTSLTVPISPNGTKRPPSCVIRPRPLRRAFGIRSMEANRIRKTGHTRRWPARPALFHCPTLRLGKAARQHPQRRDDVHARAENVDLPPGLHASMPGPAVLSHSTGFMACILPMPNGCPWKAYYSRLSSNISVGYSLMSS